MKIDGDQLLIPIFENYLDSNLRVTFSTGEFHTEK